MRIPRWATGWVTLGRPSRGRHALGHAVTAPPRAPLPRAAVLPASVPPVEPVPVAPEPELELAGPGWPGADYTWPIDVLPADLPPGPSADLDPPNNLPAYALPPHETRQMPWLAAHEEVPPQQGDPGAAQQHGRVQLGFRDGSSTVLDPDSEQAAALEELALLLTLHGHS